MSFNSLFWASKDDILNAIAKLNFQFPLLGLRVYIELSYEGRKTFNSLFWAWKGLKENGKFKYWNFQFPLLGLRLDPGAKTR